VSLNSRNAHDWTARLSAIATAAARIKAKITIDGEAVVLCPDGLSRLEELSRREAADTAILYAFDLIEHDGEDMRNRPFFHRKNLAQLLRNTEARILFNEHIAQDGPRLRARLLAWGGGHRVEEGRQHPTDPAGAASGSLSAIPPASPCSWNAVKSGTGDQVAKNCPEPQCPHFDESRNFSIEGDFSVHAMPDCQRVILTASGSPR
jgi:ATP dependent DNA ligase domain